jgi:hypothetical protein
LRNLNNSLFDQRICIVTKHTKALSLALTVILTSVPKPVLAWGQTGHAAIANVAELNLKASVWNEIKTLLATDGATHMSKVASWADSQRSASDPTHTTRMPMDGSNPAAHACTGTAMCADEAIAYYAPILADRSQPAATREIALKYIIHLIGDLHQPLHGSDPIGYNLVTVNGSTSMIHAVWDDAIIDGHGVASALLAQELMNNGVTVTLGGTPRDWAIESSNMARDKIYDVLPVCWNYKAPACPDAPVALPANYTAAKYPLAAQRLKQAGYRLAGFLNALLGS